MLIYNLILKPDRSSEKIQPATVSGKDRLSILRRVRRVSISTMSTYKVLGFVFSFFLNYLLFIR